MRLFGLLCFYDESPSQLADCVQGLKRAGVTHLVAVDGAYDLFPGGKAASPVSQRNMIDKTCRSVGMGSVIYVPKKTWAGNEVEKRTFMHRLALSVSESGDWHMVMDADQVVTTVPSDFYRRLEHTHLDVGVVQFTENNAPLCRPRILFRAIPVHLERNHYTYISGTRVLWSADDQPQEPALDLLDLVVDHQPKGRTSTRLKGRSGYYAVRQEDRTEESSCERCITGRAVKRVPARWRIDQELGYVADWIEVCAVCLNGANKESQSGLSVLGVDPNLVAVISNETMAHAVPQDGRGLPDMFREWLEGRA